MNFDKEIARELGVECAILLSNILFWVETNMANAEEKHYHDGKWWTYNTAGSFKKLFPYWKERTIYDYLKKLESAGYIVSGNYNRFKYDRTKWYSLGEKTLKNPICKKLQMDLPKSANASAESANGSAEIRGPIPDINTDKNTDKNSDTSNDWQAIVVAFYSSISPETSLRFKKQTKKEALGLLKLHSKEEILEKIQHLKTATDRRYITTFEVFVNKYSTIGQRRPQFVTLTPPTSKQSELGPQGF